MTKIQCMAPGTNNNNNNNNNNNINNNNNNNNTINNTIMGIQTEFLPNFLLYGNRSNNMVSEKKEESWDVVT